MEKEGTVGIQSLWWCPYLVGPTSACTKYWYSICILFLSAFLFTCMLKIKLNQKSCKLIRNSPSQQSCIMPLFQVGKKEGDVHLSIRKGHFSQSSKVENFTLLTGEGKIYSFNFPKKISAEQTVQSMEIHVPIFEQHRLGLIASPSHPQISVLVNIQK